WASVMRSPQPGRVAGGLVKRSAGVARLLRRGFAPPHNDSQGLTLAFRALRCRPAPRGDSRGLTLLAMTVGSLAAAGVWRRPGFSRSLPLRETPAVIASEAKQSRNAVAACPRGLGKRSAGVSRLLRRAARSSQ